jgi:hypothetical protein
VLALGSDTGVVDVSLDLLNPRVLYAAAWETRLFPWGQSNRGAGSALYRSDDGGDSWVDLRESPGFPRGPLGRIGVAASPARPGIHMGPRSARPRRRCWSSLIGLSAA